MKNNIVADSYINLLQKSLLNELYIENETRINYVIYCIINNITPVLDDIYNIRHQDQLFKLVKSTKETGNTIRLSIFDSEGNSTSPVGLRNYTELSHTMIGRKRLENIRYCIESVIKDKVPGDFIETGVWRGGATIFMRGILKAYGVIDRTVWVADSFEGVPVPTHPEDAGFIIDARVLPVLAVDMEDVKELFDRYDLLDDNVKFIKGWFRDTLHNVPIDKLAILRLDGDLYESTMDALNPLYDKVSQGGFIIVDDYYSCPPCERAISDFRKNHGIKEKIVQIDNQSVYWRKK
ncbi:MAG: hypothetical protein A2X83_13045 [Desulfuromonadales bacterium GWD2_54_10]|nr:MAG: hypothetical protein A2X83_13045 [Desulfuromonadales bacterium GWD2_54_10]